MNHLKKGNPGACSSFHGVLLGLAAVAAVGGLAREAAADVKLPALFSDNCVLQRDTAGVAVWGKADVGEEVTVAVAGQSAKATTDKDGKWLVKLPALAAGGPFEMTVSGKNMVKVGNVLVGEVWLCSGQSNMEMPIDWGAWGKIGSPEFNQQKAAANFPELRMFLVGHQMKGAAADDVVGDWRICKPDMTMMKWSAIAYFFGRDLHQNLKVPVGLIRSAVGGTPIESWMSHEAILAAAPEQKGKLEWADAQVAKSEESKAPVDPKKPGMTASNPWWPSSLYHGMIQPLEPYTIRGVIWYQGESNAGQPAYAKLFPAMIENWRKDWGNEALPFGFVQIANFQADAKRKEDQQTEPVEKAGWAVIREAQRRTLAVPNTGMACIIDIGEARNIHPVNKEEAGRRLALWAEAKVYGQSLVYSGPLYEGMQVKGKEVVLKFKDVEGGLMAKGGGEIKGFAIAGADRKFVWGKARIEGDTVVVSSEAVAAPVAVRYDWADNPIGNFYNKEGLPASPFATDDWTFEPVAGR